MKNCKKFLIILSVLLSLGCSKKDEEKAKSGDIADLINVNDVSVCSSGKIKVNGNCVAGTDTRSCLSQPANSTGGVEGTVDGGQTWSSCTGWSCSTGSTLISGSCVLTNQSRSCTSQPSHSTGGTEASTDGGQTWGSCLGYVCDLNYTNVSGSCVLTNQSRSCTSQPSYSTGGTEASTDGGQTWGSCSSFTCNSKYYLSGGACIKDTFTATYTNNNPLVACDGTQNVVQSLVSCVGQNTSVSDNAECAATSNVSMQSPAGTKDVTLLASDSVTISGTRHDTCSMGSSTPSSQTVDCSSSFTANGLTCEFKITSLSLSSLSTFVTTNKVTKAVGSRSSGQLGDGSTTGISGTFQNVPTGLSSTSFVSVISLGSVCSTSGSVVKCWGRNSSGVLGYGDTEIKSTPVSISIPGFSSSSFFAQATPKSFHTMVVVGGSLYAYGNNFHGQLGDETIEEKLSPILVNTGSGIGSITGAATGNGHSCVTDGSNVRCWGRAHAGQLGTGSTAGMNVCPFGSPSNGTGKYCTFLPNNSPLVNLGGMGTITKIVAGANHTCVTDGSTLKCWGDNTYGQLGNGLTGSANVNPITISTGLSSITMLKAGSNNTCASDGVTLKCWGKNDNGQVGNGTQLNVKSPATVVSLGLSSITDFDIGDEHTCATDGYTLKCWGQNTSGQLGDGTTNSSTIPVTANIPF